jgi:hypothetical protein
MRPQPPGPTPAEVGHLPGPGESSAGQADRLTWLAVLGRLADPVLTNLAAGRLRQMMPVEAAPGAADDRRRYTHLEAFGRLLSGIAPWLQADLPAGQEADQQRRYAGLAQQALQAAADPASPDCMNFNQGQQCLVDAAFLAQAILRAPRILWDQLDSPTQGHLVAALRSTRAIRPYFNNWVLFTGMIEAALCGLGAEWDRVRVDYAVRQLEQWYRGDGAYGDGPEFHWDFYNSFVIHPMLLDILRAVRHAPPELASPAESAWVEWHDRVLTRARRYAEVQERMIAPDGSFPPLGRSLAYRFGVFHLLSQLAWQHQLPPSLSPAQVRGALTAVIRRMATAPGTFDAQGWLTIGFCGHQPGIGEHYISTGSLYLCATGLLALGLPPSDEFWQAEPQDWTSKKLWSGRAAPADHALSAY